MEENTQEISQTPQAAVTPQHIVVFGKHDYIVKNVETLLQKGGYTTVGFIDVDEAADYIRMNSLDGTLIVGGVDPHHRQSLKDMVQAEFTHVRVIEHFGGPATILNEVQTAFKA